MEKTLAVVGDVICIGSENWYWIGEGVGTVGRIVVALLVKCGRICVLSDDTGSFVQINEHLGSVIYYFTVLHLFTSIIHILTCQFFGSV